MLDESFLLEFKRTTEARWSELSINPEIYGFQFKPGTRWNPGLSEEEIASYENDVGIRFPADFRAFLRAMNGTDLPTLNVYGRSGELYREGVGVYAYPRDRECVRRLIEFAAQDRKTLVATMADQGLYLSEADGLMPIYQHRYIVCSEDRCSSVVLSICDSEDAIVYGYSLREYLEREFLRDPIS